MFSRDYLNGEISVNELYQMQNEVWEKKNIGLFGMSSNHVMNPFLIRENLASDQENYWNNGTCKLKEHLEESSIIKDKEFMIKGTWVLEFNAINNAVGLSAIFIYSATKNGKKVTRAEVSKLVEGINKIEDRNNRIGAVMSGTYDGVDFECEKKRVAFLPLVTANGYCIKNSEYALRTQAFRHKYLLRKINGVVSQNGWVYKDGKFEDGENHFKDVKPYNYPLLNAILGEQVTEENFTKALDLMPEYDKESILYFKFRWFDEVEDSVIHTVRKSINAEKGKTLSYSSIINSPRRFSNRDLNDLCTNLVLVKNKIKALEVSRSILFSPASEHFNYFCFKDVNNLFDVFKVTTNSLAGRARVLLDNIYIEDDILKCDYKGKTYTQYDIALKNVPDEILKSSNLSSISCAPYNYLNDAKRIMFCAKLRSQSVRVRGQIDDLTHEVPARVVFADWEGFNYGDSFVISESFAKKLERDVYKIFNLDKSTLKEYTEGQDLEIQDLVDIDQKNRFSSWRDIKVTKITNENMRVEARAPFGVGDKITNMHGSKGIVSIILPDDQMPILKNDLSEDMPAGPVDVIIPGISVYRRKSTGQVFEAITRALDIPEMPLKELKEKHGEEIREYDEKSEFDFMGGTFRAPCGINHFIRLDHDATSKQSFAYIKSNYNYNLHTAEMELLNLSARGKYAILNELDIRSLNKHVNSLKKIREMQKTGIAAEEEANTPYLADYMKYLGWTLKTNQPLSKDDIEARFEGLFDIITNREIDLFDE